MHPILFQFGDRPIYAYGVMLALAIAICEILLLRTAKRYGFKEETILDISIIAIICGVLGSRLFYVYFYEWEYYSQHLLAILDLRRQGLVFYGSIIGGVLGVLLYLKTKKTSFWEISDLFAPYLALGEAIGRIGCFLNGCCYGQPTALPWGIVFPGLDAVPRHPTQIYSTLLGLGLFVFLTWFYRRRKFQGQVFLVYVMGYAVLRFIVEFFRENLVVWHSITIGQATAFGIAVLAALTYWYLDVRNKKRSAF